MKEEKLENDELHSLPPEADARNNSLPQDVNIDDPYDTVLLDLVKQELDDTLLKREPFIEDCALNEYQRVPEDINNITNHIIEENSKNCRENLLETKKKNNSIPEDMDFDNSEPHYTAPLELVKQYSDEIVVKQEPFIKNDISAEFQSDTKDIKPFTNQIIEEDGNIWCREDSAETWNFNSVKELDAGNDSKEFMFPKNEAEKKLNEIKIENVTWNLHSIKNENHQTLNNETECSKIQIKNVNEMCCSIQTERKPKQCDVLTRVDLSHLELMGHKCHFCDYNSSRKGDLQSHIRSIHLKLKNHKCHLCGYSSAYKSNLQKHIDSVHLKLKNHKCHLCDYTSSWKGHLQTHIKSVHLKLKKHECNTSNFSSSCTSHLQEPIQSIHLKMKNQKCHLCDYRSSFKADLQRHINSVHLKQKNHKCHFCDYSSSFNKDLERHINSIHLKQKNQKCHLCDHTSSRKEHLQSHINSVHLKLKNHKCHLCDFSSSRKSRLQKHIHSRHLKVKTQKYV